MTRIKSKPTTNKAAPAPKPSAPSPKPLTMKVGDHEVPVSADFYAYDQIMEILEEDKKHVADLAYNQVLDFNNRIKASRAKTLTAGVLAALGMGPPKRQGGRATILEIDPDPGPDPESA